MSNDSDLTSNPSTSLSHEIATAIGDALLKPLTSIREPFLAVYPPQHQQQQLWNTVELGTMVEAPLLEIAPRTLWPYPSVRNRFIYI